MKYIVLLSILFSMPTLAVQHWSHTVGKASSPSLGVALSTKSDEKLPSAWTSAVKGAVKNWSNYSDVSPFMQTYGFHRILIHQKQQALPAKCQPGLACASINRSNDVECSIHIHTSANSKSASFKQMLVMHEIGHCYGLAHNDSIYIGDKAHLPNEDITISRRELMHASGCPDKNHKCGVTPQAKSVINKAY